MIDNISKTTKLAISAVFVALITVGAFIRIPIPGVPFTLQIVFTTMAGLMLGGMWGGGAVAIYTLMGLIGIPVFTAGGGIMYVMQPTFGYILGFIFGAMACGFIVKKSKSKSIWIYIAASLVNMAIIYVIGVIYFYLIMTFYLAESVSSKELIIMFFSINTVPDIFKCLLASFASIKLGKIISKMGAGNVLNIDDINNNIITLKNKVIEGKKLTKNELMQLEHCDLELLSNAANEIRKQLKGDVFHTCTIINAKSGKCSENCKFCAQSAANNCDIKEYDLLPENDIIDSAKIASNQGINNFSLVTSGRKINNEEIDKICDIIVKIKSTENIDICSSHGLLNYEQLSKLKAHGLDRYHNNLESSKKYFKSLCTTHTYDDKIDTINAAIAAGLKVCSGGIIGLGESFADRVEMAIKISTLAVDSVPLNMYVPVETNGAVSSDNTSEKQEINSIENAEETNKDGKEVIEKKSTQAVSYDEFIRAVAMFRFAMPNNYIRLAGGRSLMPDKGERAFLSGANATITGDLLTTAGIDAKTDREMITRLGFIIE